MNLLVQVCVVILTLSFLATAIATWRILGKVDAFTRSASLGIEDLRRTASQAQQVIAKLQDAAQGVQRGASQFQGVATRAANVSHRIIDQIERPARGAAAFATGIRVGAAALLGRRVPHYSTHQYNGGERHG